MESRKALAPLTIVLIIAALVAVAAIGSNHTGNFALPFLQNSGSSTTSPSSPSSSTGQARQPSQVGTITYTNLAQELSKNQIVQALPTNAIIMLRLYNVVNGQKIFERSYVITKANAVEGTTATPDITLLLPSYYLPQLTSSNFCAVIKSAKANQDLTIQLGISKLSLLWKYKSIMGYRDCLGF